jgi:hypothetical protein
MLHFTKSLCTILIGFFLLLFVASEARADTMSLATSALE